MDRPHAPDAYIFETAAETTSAADFLRKACAYATAHSDDKDTQNGAVLVSSSREVFAANMVPGRVQVTDERVSRPLKYQFIEHAERTSILRAALNGVQTDGATVYCPWYACIDCARAIIVSGIKRVVGLKRLRDLTPERWMESIATADLLLKEAGVETELIDETLGVTIRFNGTDVQV